MIRTVGTAPSRGGRIENDPWIPATVNWDVEAPTHLLHLYARGKNGGYVELKIDASSGALAEMVVIDLPPLVDRAWKVKDSPHTNGSPLLDLAMWNWKNTPDYKEPLSRDIDVSQKLCYSLHGGESVLWFSDGPVSRYLSSGVVRVGIGTGNEIVNVNIGAVDA